MSVRRTPRATRSLTAGPAGRSRRVQTPLVGAVLLGMCLIGIGLLSRSRGDSSIVPAEGGWLREAVAGSAARVNPLDAGASPAERDLAALVFTGLTRPGPDGMPRPALAESWQVSDDARTFTFTLRNGLTWHDGHSLSAADVLFTVGALASMADRVDPRLLDVWVAARVTAIDDSTVGVELANPFAGLPSFAAFGLLPAHLLQAEPPANLAGSAFFRAPVGAGPFRLRALASDGARVERFEGYALGTPWLAGVDLRFVPGGSEPARVLHTGESLAALVTGAAPPSTGEITVQTAGGSAYTAVLLNHRLDLFTDPRVRRALSAALDRPALAMSFEGVACDTPFPPGWWASDGVAAPAVDLDGALKLLGEAGWSRGIDGIARREGRDLAFTLVVPVDAGRVALAQALVRSWEVIGARVTVEPVETAALTRDFLLPRSYQAALVGWDPGPDPDPFSAWHSSLRGRADGNYGDASDPELDALAVDGRLSGSYARRREAYLRFAARFREVTPGIVLFAARVNYAIRPPLAGVSIGAMSEPANRFNDVHRWHIRTRDVD